MRFVDDPRQLGGCFCKVPIYNIRVYTFQKEGLTVQLSSHENANIKILTADEGYMDELCSNTK